MSTPARRRQRSHSEPELVGIVIVTVACVAFATGIALGHAGGFIWAVITAVITAVAYGLGRSHEKRKPASESRQAKRAAARQASLRARTDRKASRNGWLPPANPQLTTLTVSRECAKGDCVACPGGGCQCTCNHDSAVIVARNAAAYDAADHSDDPPPF